MSYCAACGRQLPEEGVAFCPYCGKPSKGQSPAPSEPPQVQGYVTQPSQMQVPPYSAPTGMAPSVPSHMAWSIVSLVLFFWPTAIPAVVYASRVNSLLTAGDVPGAIEASNKAKTWCVVSTVIAAFSWVIWIVIYVALLASI